MELVAKIAWNLLPWESTGETAQDVSTTFRGAECGPVLGAGKEILDALDIVAALSTIGPMGTFAESI